MRDGNEAAAHWAGDVVVAICVWKAFRGSVGARCQGKRPEKTSTEAGDGSEARGVYGMGEKEGFLAEVSVAKSWNIGTMGLILEFLGAGTQPIPQAKPYVLCVHLAQISYLVLPPEILHVAAAVLGTTERMLSPPLAAAHLRLFA